MRAYVPLRWAQLAQMHRTGRVDGPLSACVVDPAWRAGSIEVDEEQWEFEAQSAAAQEVGGDSGVVLAVDIDGIRTPIRDGWLTHPGPIDRAAAAAVLTGDLAWYAVQEVADLLAAR